MQLAQQQYFINKVTNAKKSLVRSTNKNIMHASLVSYLVSNYVKSKLFMLYGNYLSILLSYVAC